MAKTKVKPDNKLYDKLRDSGVRKKVAGRVAEALPRKGDQKPSRAAKVAEPALRRSRFDSGSDRRWIAQAQGGREESSSIKEGEVG